MAKSQQIGTEPAIPPAALDLVGIGALNLDYVATRERLLTLDQKTVPELPGSFERGAELCVDETEIERVLSQVGNSFFEKSLGGSAFNAVHVIASLDLDLRLGYIGVAGETGAPHMSFPRAFDHLGIDTQFVYKIVGQKTGLCLSYLSQGERSLLTWPGANAGVPDFFLDNYDDIVKEVSGFFSASLAFENGIDVQLSATAVSCGRERFEAVVYGDDGELYFDLDTKLKGAFLTKRGEVYPIDVFREVRDGPAINTSIFLASFVCFARAIEAAVNLGEVDRVNCAARFRDALETQVILDALRDGAVSGNVIELRPGYTCSANV